MALVGEEFPPSRKICHSFPRILLCIFQRFFSCPHFFRVARDWNYLQIQIPSQVTLIMGVPEKNEVVLQLL